MLTSPPYKHFCNQFNCFVDANLTISDHKWTVSLSADKNRQEPSRSDKSRQEKFYGDKKVIDAITGVYNVSSSTINTLNCAYRAI